MFTVAKQSRTYQPPSSRNTVSSSASYISALTIALDCSVSPTPPYWTLIHHQPTLLGCHGKVPARLETRCSEQTPVRVGRLCWRQAPRIDQCVPSL